MWELTVVSHELGAMIFQVIGQALANRVLDLVAFDLDQVLHRLVGAVEETAPKLVRLGAVAVLNALEDVALTWKRGYDSFSRCFAILEPAIMLRMSC